MPPYLSVVVTTRNDDHGGNLLRRTQTFVNALLAQCERHSLPAELIMVEWNPPEGRPHLAQALRWPVRKGYCEVRVVEVPGEVHARYRHSHALPLYQMIAKNTGIRRARGEFVLATNIDILFSDELMRFIAARRLKRENVSIGSLRCDGRRPGGRYRRRTTGLLRFPFDSREHPTGPSRALCSETTSRRQTAGSAFNRAGMSVNWTAPAPTAG